MHMTNKACLKFRPSGFLLAIKVPFMPEHLCFSSQYWTSSVTPCGGLNRRHPQVVRSEVPLWRIYSIYSFFFFFFFFEEQVLSLLILERSRKYQLVFFPSLLSPTDSYSNLFPFQTGNTSTTSVSVKASVTGIDCNYVWLQNLSKN